MNTWARLMAWLWLYTYELIGCMHGWLRARIYGPGGPMWDGNFVDSDLSSFPNLQDGSKPPMDCPETQPTSNPGLLDTDHQRLR